MPNRELSERVVRVFGKEGSAWLEKLPRLIDRLSTLWELERVDPPFPGSRASFVAPALGSRGERLILKITPDRPGLEHEHDALAYWCGAGAVKVVRDSLADGAILLEGAAPGEALRESRDRPGDAASVFAKVAADLGDRRWPAPQLPSITTWLEHLAADALPGVGAHSDRARQIGQDVLARTDRMVVLHGDLHHGNLLGCGSSWVAIDPKGVLGPREAEPAAFLRNPRKVILAHPDPVELTIGRVSVISRILDCDPHLVLAWAYVLAVLAARWSIEDGEGDEETDRGLCCAEIMRGARAKHDNR